MYRIDHTKPCFNQHFSSFIVCLNTLELELHGDLSNSIQADFLWKEIRESREIYIGDTSHGPLYITMIETINGTTYSPTFGG